MWGWEALRIRRLRWAIHQDESNASTVVLKGQETAWSRECVLCELW